MKDYKRLTERDEFGNADIIGVDSEILASALDFDKLNKLTFALNKFADLEDKIESGELCDRKETAREIERLKSENAALRVRLGKAVELKAKVGDVIYMPWEYDGSNGVATLSIIGSDFHNDEFIYITDLESDSAIYLSKYKYGIFQNEDFNNIVFTNCSEAESCLAELKKRGEKKVLTK